MNRVGLFLCLLIFLLAGSLWYFRPLQLSGRVTEKGKLYVVAMEIGVTEGEPYINSENYNEITDRQRKEIKGKMK